MSTKQNHKASQQKTYNIKSKLHSTITFLLALDHEFLGIDLVRTTKQKLISKKICSSTMEDNGQNFSKNVALTHRKVIYKLFLFFLYQFVL